MVICPISSDRYKNAISEEAKNAFNSLIAKSENRTGNEIGEGIGTTFSTGDNGYSNIINNPLISEEIKTLNKKRNVGIKLLSKEEKAHLFRFYLNNYSYYQESEGLFVANEIGKDDETRDSEIASCKNFIKAGFSDRVYLLPEKAWNGKRPDAIYRDPKTDSLKTMLEFKSVNLTNTNDAVIDGMKKCDFLWIELKEKPTLLGLYRKINGALNQIKNRPYMSEQNTIAVHNKETDGGSCTKVVGIEKQVKRK